MLKKYFNRHFRFKDLLESNGEVEQQGIPPRRKVKRTFRIFVRLLRLLPFLCLGAFITSFFVDFGPREQIVLFGNPLGLESLIRMVSVSGLIGFCTNWIAIKMLFKPVYRRPVWGQGLIPAQKDRVVWQLAGGIHTFILSEDLIRERIEESGLIRRVNQIILQGTENLLHDAEFRRELKAVVYKYLKKNMSREEVRERFTRIIDTKLEANLQKGLKGLVFKTYKTLNRQEYEMLLNNVLDRVPGTVVEIIEELENESESIVSTLKAREGEMEKFFTKVIRDILERIDLRVLLSEQMSHFDEAKLEQMIWRATNQQLLYIQYLGTLLGILGGLLIWQPLAVGILYACVLVLLFLLDITLHRLKRQKT